MKFTKEEKIAFVKRYQDGETDNILCTKKLSQPVSSATQHLSTGEFGEELVTLRYRKFAL